MSRRSASHGTVAIRWSSRDWEPPIHPRRRSTHAPSESCRRSRDEPRGPGPVASPRSNNDPCTATIPTTRPAYISNRTYVCPEVPLPTQGLQQLGAAVGDHLEIVAVGREVQDHPVEALVDGQLAQPAADHLG